MTTTVTASKSQEFKILTGSEGEVQRILNQWKHKYRLHLIDFAVTHLEGWASPDFHILLLRDPREGE